MRSSDNTTPPWVGTLAPVVPVPRPRGTGNKRMLDMDTVIFAIGDRVDESFGLPVARNEFVKNPSPRFPIDELSYEAYDPETNSPISDVFVGGWSRKASDGLVGLARKDGTNAAKAVIEYLQTLPTVTADLPAIAQRMKSLRGPIITQDEIEKLSAVEKAEAEKRGLPEFKFGTNDEMLQAIGLAEAAA